MMRLNEQMIKSSIAVMINSQVYFTVTTLVLRPDTALQILFEWNICSRADIKMVKPLQRKTQAGLSYNIYHCIWHVLTKLATFSVRAWRLKCCLNCNTHIVEKREDL